MIQDAGTRRMVIVVLGMHRAGTSLTTAMLQALGVRLSADLMPPTEDNPMGYFESTAIVDAHNAILAALDGRTWATSSSMVPFPATWTSLPQMQPLREHLQAIVSAELAASTQPWGFKDPRTAQLLPLWREIAGEFHLDMRFLIVLRHPREVAQSVHVRDGFSPVRGELLWLEHYLDALMYTQAAERAFISYDAWFGDAVGTAKSIAAQLRLPQPDDERVKELLATLFSPSLRHHRQHDETGLLPFTRDFYVSLLRGDEGMLQTLVPLLHLRRVFSAQVVASALEITSKRIGEQQQRIAQLESQLAALLP